MAWPKPKPLADRLKAKIDVSGGPDAGHPWTGARRTKRGVPGYGHLGNAGRTVLAHRAIWLETFGVIPSETPMVLHRCDNPLCCNVRHLFLGTNSTNVLDMIAKGRGRLNGEAKASITSSLRIRMREDYAAGKGTMREIAASCGVSYGAARAAILGLVA